MPEALPFVRSHGLAATASALRTFNRVDPLSDIDAIPAAIIASSEKHLAEAELRMFEDGLDFDTIAELIAEMRTQNQRVAEQVRDALPRLRHALATRDHFEPGELQALIFSGGKSRSGEV